jgi:hypothetical protein
VTAAHDLLAALGPAADFADAPCVGHWGLFDPRGDRESTADLAERHEAAVRVCGTCPIPVFARCAALTRTLPKAGRHGVWAGRSFDSADNLPQRARPPPRCTRANPPNLNVRPRHHTNEGASPC